MYVRNSMRSETRKVWDSRQTAYLESINITCVHIIVDMYYNMMY